MQNEKCEKPGPLSGIATGVSCTWDGRIHEVLGPSQQGAASDKFRPISMIFIRKVGFLFFNVIDEEFRNKNDDFWWNLQIWTPVDSYASHPDTSATGTTLVGSAKSTEMRLMLRFLRENTCKHSFEPNLVLPAWNPCFATVTTWGKGQWCVGVGNDGLAGCCDGVMTCCVVQTVYLWFVSSKGAWRGTRTRWLRMELSSIRNGVRSASRICKVFWTLTVSIVSTWRACSVR